MITEDYVSFETAKLLKEKGFDAEGVSEFGGYYVDYKHNGQDVGIATESMMLNKTLEDWECLRPTLQMVMKWLREVHHYYIQIMLDSWACGGHMGYYVVIQKTDSDFNMMLQDTVDEVFYQTYEEACEAGIKYILEDLIYLIRKRSKIVGCGGNTSHNTDGVSYQSEYAAPFLID